MLLSRLSSGLYIIVCPFVFLAIALSGLVGFSASGYQFGIFSQLFHK